MSVTHHRDTLVSLLVQRAREQPDLPLFTFLDSAQNVSAVLTSRRLLCRARHIAGALQARALCAEPVMVLSPRGPAFLEMLFGVLLAGCAPVPVTYHPRLGMANIVGIIEDVDVRVVLGYQATLDKLKARRMTSGSSFAQQHPDLLCLSVESLPRADWEPPDIAGTGVALIYPGLLSDEPVATRALTHAQLIASVDGLQRALVPDSSDRLLTALDLADGMALVLHVLLPLRAAIRGWFLPTRQSLQDATAWLSAVSRHSCSIVSAPPAILSLATHSVSDADAEQLNLSPLRLVCVGGDQVAPDVISRFIERYADKTGMADIIFTCYGLSAACLYIAGRRGYRSRCVDGIDYLALGAPDQTLLQASETGDQLILLDGELYCKGRKSHRFMVDGQTFQAEDIESVVLQNFGLRGLSRCVVLHQDEIRQTVVLVECATWQLAEQWQGMVSAIMDTVAARTGCRLDRVILLRPGSLPLAVSGIVLRQRCAQALADGSLMLRLLPVRGK